MSDFIIKPANFVAWAVNNNAVLALLYLALLYLAYDFIAGLIEKLIWGETFLHAVDIIVALAFFAFSFVVVYRCAINNYIAGNP